MKIKLVLKETLPNLIFIVSTSLLYYYFYLFIITSFFFCDLELINVMCWKKKKNKPTDQQNFSIDNMPQNASEWCSTFITSPNSNMS